jgi:hypothetical protein
MLINEPTGHVDKLYIGVFGSVRQHVERLQTGDIVAVHQDAFGLPNDIAAGQCGVEMVFSGRADHRHGGEMFLQMLDDGVAPFQGAAEVLDWLGAQGIPIAVVSSSQNAQAVLQAAGLRDKVDLVVDGVVALRTGLAGKPNPTPICMPPTSSASAQCEPSWSRTHVRALQPGAPAGSGSSESIEAPAGRSCCTTAPASSSTILTRCSPTTGHRHHLPTSSARSQSDGG